MVMDSFYAIILKIYIYVGIDISQAIVEVANYVMMLFLKSF